MLSINQAKLIRSLQKKKHRDLTGLYIIEGDKLLKEYLDSGEEIILLAGKPEWLARIESSMLTKVNEVVETNYQELKKVSSLTTPHNSLAVVKMRKPELTTAQLKGRVSIVLDHVQDPGNLGTIIRTAAWFGIKNIICSDDCVDQYNPKVVQSTMGALLSTDVYYVGLEPFLQNLASEGFNIYAATLNGEPIYSTVLSEEGIILFGNESAGISQNLVKLATLKISIPQVNSPGPGVESLNIATSVAVVCSEFVRRKQ